MQVCQFSTSSSLQFLSRRILNLFFENLPFMSPRQPIKLRDLDNSRMQYAVRQQKLSISSFPIISLWEINISLSLLL